MFQLLTAAEVALEGAQRSTEFGPNTVFLQLHFQETGGKPKR